MSSFWKRCGINSDTIEYALIAGLLAVALVVFAICVMLISG